MQDLFGRAIRYLRLSITPACSMRCVYCRPAIMPGSSRDQLLSPSEMESLARHLVLAHGLEKVRVTGGEPTARADLLEIIGRLSALGLRDLAMTTNGLTLERQGLDLVRAGLRRVNVSLDSLDRERFRRITGVDGMDRVIRGLVAALAAGLSPVKLNTVVVRGENEDELADLLLFAADRDLEIRFIELMPMGPLADRWAERFVPESEIRQRLSPVVDAWKQQPMGSESARRYQVALRDGRQARIGFISAMTCPFCEGCSRLRIASDAVFYPCLMDRPAGSLMAAIRPEFDADRLDELLMAGLRQKQGTHPATGFAVMTSIGG